jgi:hypothetical protein
MPYGAGSPFYMQRDARGGGHSEPGAILLELPYRPLGGQLPTWDEL